MSEDDSGLMPDTVIADFYADWVEMLRQQLLGAGYAAPPGEAPIPFVSATSILNTGSSRSTCPTSTTPRRRLSTRFEAAQRRATFPTPPGWRWQSSLSS